MRLNFSNETYQDTIQSQAVEIQQLRKENERLKQENKRLFLNAVRH
jgi:cell division protein FtsB